MNKKVFITYSWDTNEHKDWVRNLADQLIDKGIEVDIDQYDLSPGVSLTHFMEVAIERADRVLVILTPEYRKKSLEGKGGVGYEQHIISGKILSGVDRKKFIPIIRQGTIEDGKDCAIPPQFQGILVIDFTSTNNIAESFDLLIRTIYEEYSLKKPALGSKPNFGNGKEAVKKIFSIEIDKNFNCVQSEIYLTDIFLQIADLRKENLAYSINFKIEEVSEKFNIYEKLIQKTNLSEKEISDKLEIRFELDETFFLPHGNLYEYLESAINVIIDYNFNTNKNIRDFSDLYLAIKNCIELFSFKNRQKTSNKTGFQVFSDENDWSFRIYLPENEVEDLQGIVGSKDRMMLTQFWGLDVHDLSYNRLIEDVIPKKSYYFVMDFFEERDNEQIKKEFFTRGNWKIGLA